jgi:hypothetical protein
MKESEFYEMLEKIEEVDKSTTAGWYPTVDELREYGITENGIPEPCQYMLAFFSTDPYKDRPMSGKDRKEYSTMVKYARDITPRFKCEDSPDEQ